MRSSCLQLAAVLSEQGPPEDGPRADGETAAETAVMFWVHSGMAVH